MEEDTRSGGRRGIRKEERDMSVLEMKKAILTHEEKSIDELIERNILKQGSRYREVCQLQFLFRRLTCRLEVALQVLTRKMILMNVSTKAKKTI